MSSQNRISMCMTRPLGRQCFPPESTRGDTYGWRWVVYLMVQVDGDVVCSAWMVLHGMAPRTKYANNRFSYVRVHGMALVLGTGRAGWWCCTPVVTGGHSRRGTVHSSMRPHSAYMQVHSGPLGGAPQRPWGMENPYGYKWSWLGTTLQCLLMASGAHGGQHAGCLDKEGVWGPLWQGVVAHGGDGAYNPQDIAKRLALEGAMCETVCPCSGRCKCKAPAPKFEWMRQAEMAECWKYMVPNLTAAGVADLSCCLSYEQFWQRCGDCRVKVLRQGGETGMPAQVLHLTNQGQSVRQRVKEGMKGRPVGLPDKPPPPLSVRE